MKLKTKLLYALSGALAALLLSSALPVLAAQIEAAFNIVNIVVDGKSVAKTGESYKLADGTEVPYSIAYKGTTYLPLKKLGEILGFNASWDGETSTANVSSEAEPGTIPVSPPQPSATQTTATQTDEKVTVKLGSYDIEGVLYNGDEYVSVGSIRDIWIDKGDNYGVSFPYNEETDSLNSEIALFIKAVSDTPGEDWWIRPGEYTIYATMDFTLPVFIHINGGRCVEASYITDNFSVLID
jgi:hypothetical protein